MLINATLFGRAAYVRIEVGSRCRSTEQSRRRREFVSYKHATPPELKRLRAPTIRILQAVQKKQELENLLHRGAQPELVATDIAFLAGFALCLPASLTFLPDEVFFPKCLIRMKGNINGSPNPP